MFAIVTFFAEDEGLRDSGTLNSIKILNIFEDKPDIDLTEMAIDYIAQDEGLPRNEVVEMYKDQLDEGDSDVAAYMVGGTDGDQVFRIMDLDEESWQQIYEMLKKAFG